jgi:hypothetical protein
MRYLGLSFVVVVLVASAWNHAAMTPSAAATDETQAVLQVSRERFKAINTFDATTFNRDTSAAYHHVDYVGLISDKAASTKNLHLPYPASFSWASTPAVSFVDGVAIVMGSEIFTENHPGGKVINRLERTEMYAKENGRWVAIHTQVTPLQVNYTHPSVSPKNLDQYVGKYQWDPGEVEEETTRGHVLYSVLGGPPDPMFFVGPDSTTLSDDLGVGTYYRDAHGKVIGYIYKRCDGQTIRVPKIK